MYFYILNGIYSIYIYNLSENQKQTANVNKEKVKTINL